MLLWLDDETTRQFKAMLHARKQRTVDMDFIKRVDDSIHRLASSMTAAESGALLNYQTSVLTGEDDMPCKGKGKGKKGK